MNYPNLYIERKKRHESCEVVANFLGISRQAFTRKHYGQSEFTIGECIKLSERYERSLDYLFKEVS